MDCCWRAQRRDPELDSLRALRFGPMSRGEAAARLGRDEGDFPRGETRGGELRNLREITSSCSSVDKIRRLGEARRGDRFGSRRGEGIFRRGDGDRAALICSCSLTGD